MSVFGNRAINRAYVHVALRACAERSGGLFILVFLLKSGVPAPLVFCTMAAITFGRLVLRPGVLPLARRIGLRNVLIVGVLLQGGFYSLVPWVDGLGPRLFALVAFGALASVLYWTSYHAYISALGDAEHRGGQVGVIQAVNALTDVFAPILGGVALVGMSSFFAFYGAGFVMALSAAPLLFAPNVAVAAEAPIERDAARFVGWLFFADGWSEATSGMVWQIALFQTLGERFDAYGGAMGLASVVGALMSVALGRAIDLGHGQRSIKIAYGASALVIVLRAAGFDAPVMAVTANALAAVASSLLAPVFCAPVYNAAKRSACPLRFHMIGERGWDLGCAAANLIAAALLAAGASYTVLLALALLSAGAAYGLLRQPWMADAEASPSPTRQAALSANER